MKKNRKFVVIIVMLTVLSSITFGVSKIGDKIGDVLFTDIVTEINSQEVESFNINGSTAIYVSDLKKIPGVTVTWNSEQRKVIVSSETIVEKEESSNEQSNDIDIDKGFSRDYPMELGEVITLIDNENQNMHNISITEIIRGPEAYNIVKAENQFNDDLGSGYEYLLAKVKITVVELTTNSIEVDGYWDFDAVSSDGITYDNVSVTFDDTSDYEEFNRKLYEGAEFEGWASFVVRKDDNKPKALYGDQVWFNLYK